MNLKKYLFLSIVAFLLLNNGCEKNPTEPTTTKTTTVSGTVLDAGGVGIPLARVIDLGSIAPVDTSNTNGSYTLTMQLTNNYNTSIYAVSPGRISDTLKVSLNPGDNLTGQNIHMTVVDSTQIVNGISGRASRIGLLTQTANEILLKGGINQASTLTFLVVDSLNRPVTGTNKCWVKFSISVSHPSGETIKPDTAQTDALTGQVSTTVFSGTMPNAILVTAQVIDPVHRIVATAGLTEGTGLPDGNHVSIAATTFNIAGRVYDGLTTSITLTVNDQFGNHVADGTQVNFITNGGGINYYALTTNGVATGTLMSGGGNPPVGSLVTVTAEVKGDTSVRKADSSIVRTIPILFSGPTQVKLETSGLYSVVNFTVPNGGAKTCGFWVSDDHGFPLVAGSTVTVTMAGADTLLKDLQLLFGTNGVYTFTDTQDTNATHLYIGVLDKGTSTIAGNITFGIQVTSKNGNYSNPNWFTGYVSGGGSGNFNVPATIQLADSSHSPTTLYLSETGTPGTSGTIKFVVMDALGNVIGSPSKSAVNFTLLQAPNGTHLNKSMDSTNSSGAVFVNITAGDTAGWAQVLATIVGVNGPTSAYSFPIQVAHGLPDSNKVFVTLNKNNMFNNYGSQVGIVNLNLYDISGDYAAPQNNITSDIVVSTTGGYAGRVPYTVLGKASVPLYGGSPEPSDPILGVGFGYVRASVLVHGGGRTTKSVPFLFSYAPLITFTNTPNVIIDTVANALLNSLNNGGQISVNYAVKDKNGKPISSGNSITVTVSGPVASSIGLTGDINISNLPDTQDPSKTAFNFVISGLSSSTSQGAFRITITVTGESGTAVRTLDGFLLGPNVLGGSTSGFAKSIILENPLVSRSIYVQGSGGAGSGRPTTATLEFQALDSLNRPVDAAHAVTMYFAFQGQTFGATIERTSGTTDATGSFTTVVESGSLSGVPYVVAYAVINGDTIKSGLVDILISTGFAVPSRFSVAAASINFPGMQWDGLIDIIRVQAGDQFGNPVPQNTPVWFSCTNGVVQTEAAYTDINGIINQNYYSEGQRPIVPNNVPGQTNGFTFVKARTMGEGGTDIWDSVKVLWTGAPVDPNTRPVTGPNPFTVPHGGSAGPWTFQIRDAWGNPLSAGTTITVSADGTVADMDPVTLPDTQVGANGAAASGITNFVVNIHDTEKSTDTDNHNNISTTLRVTVVHQVYGTFTFVLASGVVDP